VQDEVPRERITRIPPVAAAINPVAAIEIRAGRIPSARRYEKTASTRDGIRWLIVVAGADARPEIERALTLRGDKDLLYLIR